jgi:hypothetical protein
MMNDWKDRLGVVYSTAADFDSRTAESEEAETLAPAAQQLRVRIEKKGAGGGARRPLFRDLWAQVPIWPISAAH